MKLNGAVLLLMIVALAIAATVYRVVTAPERTRMRLATAKASCINAGGAWVKLGHEDLCQPATASPAASSPSGR